MSPVHLTFISLRNLSKSLTNRFVACRSQRLSENCFSWGFGVLEQLIWLSEYSFWNNIDVFLYLDHFRFFSCKIRWDDFAPITILLSFISIFAEILNKIYNYHKINYIIYIKQKNPQNTFINYSINRNLKLKQIESR